MQKMLDRVQKMSLPGCHNFMFVVFFYNEEHFVKISYNNEFILYSGYLKVTLPLAWFFSISFFFSPLFSICCELYCHVNHFVYSMLQ